MITLVQIEHKNLISYSIDVSSKLIVNQSTHLGNYSNIL